MRQRSAGEKTAGEKNSITESSDQLEDICKKLSDAENLRLAVTFQMAKALGGEIVFGDDFCENSFFSLIIPEIDSSIQTPMYDTEPAEAVRARAD